jgi:hypothetical protein
MTLERLTAARPGLAAFLGLMTLAAPACFGAEPPPGPSVPPPGTWRLIPLPDEKVPAAWVINTATGATYLCGSGSSEGRARVACIQADFAPQPGR